MANTFNEEIDQQIADHQQEKLLKKVNNAVNFHKKTQELERINSGKKLAQELENLDLTTNFDALADAAHQDALDRAESVELLFPELGDFALFGPRSLALFCAATGTGKSTLTANIAYSLIARGKRVLIIANEETRQDVAVRISCLQLGVNIHAYMKKDGIPPSLKKNAIENIRNLTDHQLSIIAQDYNNDSRYVTSAECVMSILREVTRIKDTPKRYDAVIIDYYQNINQSINNPGLQAHEANEIFARGVDAIKNDIGCPIIMMAQIRPGDDFYVNRLEGRRLILNKCTDILEIIIDKPNKRSLLKCYKDRWNGNQGTEKFVGYHMGLARFVPYTKEYEASIKKDQVAAVDAMTSDP